MTADKMPLRSVDLEGIIETDADGVLSRVDLSEIEGKSILVTGASGLIGGFFLACLNRFAGDTGKNFEVVAVTRGGIPHHMTTLLNKRVRVVNGDLSDSNFCADLPAVDYIIHGAGYAQPQRFMEDPKKTLLINTTSTFALLERLRPDGKFLFISTSELYSGLPNPPYKESDIGTTNTTHPRACYIEAKRCGEAICNAYRSSGVAAKSARLSLAYGPGTRPGDSRVINSFIRQAMRGRITLLDQGVASRTYCYISDAVEVMWSILLRGRDPIYNVGGTSQTTIRGLALMIGEYVDVPVIFPEDPNEVSGAPLDVSLDMGKAHEEFGEREYVSLEEGLRRTIEWQKYAFQELGG